MRVKCTKLASDGKSSPSEAPYHSVRAEGDCYRAATNEDGATTERVRRGHGVIDEASKIVDAQTPVTAKESAKLALEKL